MSLDLSFYAGKNVLVTGHTGFKGSWLCHILATAGANVAGYALNPPTSPNLFSIAHIEDEIDSRIGDVRDFETLLTVFREKNPEIVFHLAAQPIVLEGYQNPRDTYEINLMGTVNVLEAARITESARSIVNITTDKVYQNHEWPWGYRENDPLDGFDPYSNSKSCSDIATHCYRQSFFENSNIAVSSARAGNVIGGGDFSPNRIIPDCVRAALSKEPLIVRNPESVRPYQHVLEPLFAYLMIAHQQAEDASLASAYNIGPEDKDCVATGKLADIFAKYWGSGFIWKSDSHETPSAPHEASMLKLDSSLIQLRLGWKPTLSISEAVSMTVDWTKAWSFGESVRSEMNREISLFHQKNNQNRQ